MTIKYFRQKIIKIIALNLKLANDLEHLINSGAF